MLIGKVIQYPIAQEKSYSKYLLGLLNDLEKQTKQAVRYYQDHPPNIIKDSYIDDIEQILSLIEGYSIDDFIVQDLIARALNLYKFTAKQVIKSLSNIFKVTVPEYSPDVNNLGVNIFGTNLPLQQNIVELTKGWAINNSRLIKSIEAQYLDNVARTMFEGYRGGLSLKTLKEQLIKDYGISENRAQLIARDQIGKLHGNYVEAEHKLLGIKYYIWSSSNDKAVRASHRAMEGKICRWDDATVYKDHIDDAVWKLRKSIGGVELHPGQDFQCRCESRAVIDKWASSREVFEQNYKYIITPRNQNSASLSR